MTDEPELPIFQLLGEAKLTAMVAAFYRRIPDDALLGPMYAGDFAGAERRLRQFLLYRFGGPPIYLQERGHPRLRMRHAPFAVDAAARERWMQLMLEAIDEVGISQAHRDYLERFLGGIATFLINRQ